MNAYDLSTKLNFGSDLSRNLDLTLDLSYSLSEQGALEGVLGWSEKATKFFHLKSPPIGRLPLEKFDKARMEGVSTQTANGGTQLVFMVSNESSCDPLILGDLFWGSENNSGVGLWRVCWGRYLEPREGFLSRELSTPAYLSRGRSLDPEFQGSVNSSYDLVRFKSNL